MQRIYRRGARIGIANDARRCANADRKLWEGALNEKYQAFRTAKLKVADIKEELKQAKKALKLLQDELNNEVAQGSKDYQNRERTLFDNV